MPPQLSPAPTGGSPSAPDKTKPKGFKKISPYDRNFEQKLVDCGVYLASYRCPDGEPLAKPKNLAEIQERLKRTRPSSFSEADHEKFVEADMDATKEQDVIISVLPTLMGPIADTKCVSRNIRWANLAPLMSKTLVPGNPDIYYGARPKQLNQQVRDELSDQIIPSTQDGLPMLPNFMLAAKGPEGTWAVANRQACYDGALGARAMHSLQSYGLQRPLFDNKAYTITSIYCGGTLKIFASFPVESADTAGISEFHMCQLRSFAMTDTAETFRQGAAAYKNARDWAKEQRDEAIKQANKRFAEHQAKTAAAVPSPKPVSTGGVRAGEASGVSRESREEQDKASSSAAIDSRGYYTTPPEVESRAQATKRSSEQAEQGSPIQRKRRRPSGEADGHSQQSEALSFEASGFSQPFEQQTLGQIPGSQSSDDSTITP